MLHHFLKFNVYTIHIDLTIDLTLSVFIYDCIKLILFAHFFLKIFRILYQIFSYLFPLNLYY